MSVAAPLTPVMVGWVDSTLLDSGQWVDADTIPGELQLEQMVHESVGYLVCESHDGIALAGSRNDSGTRLSNVIVIPRAAITRGPTRLGPGVAGD